MLGSEIYDHVPGMKPNATVFVRTLYHEQRTLLVAIGVLFWPRTRFVVVVAHEYSLHEACTLAITQRLNDALGMQVCPSCAESIQDAAKACRFCDHSFEQMPARLQKSGRFNIGVIIILLVVLFILSMSSIQS
jgi:hypothetical protein